MEGFIVFLTFLLVGLPIIGIIVYLLKESTKREQEKQKQEEKQKQLDKIISDKNQKLQLKIPEFTRLAKNEVINDATSEYLLDEFYRVFGFGTESFVFSDAPHYNAFARNLLSGNLVDVDFINNRFVSGINTNSTHIGFNSTAYNEFKRIIDIKYSSYTDTDILIFCLFKECLLKNLSKYCGFFNDEIDITIFQKESIENIVRTYFELYTPTSNTIAYFISAYLLQKELFNDPCYVIESVNTAVEKLFTEQKLNKLNGAPTPPSSLTTKIKKQREEATIFQSHSIDNSNSQQMTVSTPTETKKEEHIIDKQVVVSLPKDTKKEDKLKTERIQDFASLINNIIEYKSSEHFDRYIEEYKCLKKDFGNTNRYDNQKLLFNAKILYEANRIYSNELQQVIENFMSLKPNHWFDDISNYNKIKIHLLKRTQNQFKFNITDLKFVETPTADVIKDFEQFKSILTKHYNINKEIINEVFVIVINKAVIYHYHQKWLKFCGGFLIGNLSIKEYTDVCLSRGILNRSDNELLTAYYYYIASVLNGKIQLLYPNKKMVDDINAYINTYERNKKDEKFEALLFRDIDTQEKAMVTIDDVDLMTGLEFEEFIAKLFIKMGYSAKTTKGSGDQGIDVIAEKNGIKFGIQCKCYTNTVSNSAIQEVVAGKQLYNLDKLIVITNNYFTKSAQQLARANNVVLWDRTILKEKLSEM